MRQARQVRQVRGILVCVAAADKATTLSINIGSALTRDKKQTGDTGALRQRKSMSQCPVLIAQCTSDGAKGRIIDHGELGEGKGGGSNLERSLDLRKTDDKMCGNPSPQGN